jgi:hypothetical protein
VYSHGRAPLVRGPWGVNDEDIAKNRYSGVYVPGTRSQQQFLLRRPLVMAVQAWLVGLASTSVISSVAAPAMSTFSLAYRGRTTLAHMRLRDTAETWLTSTYDSIDYEQVLFADRSDADVEDDFMDDDDEMIYGESQLTFFLDALGIALDECSGDGGGFIDLGGGKGQLALAAAYCEPGRLKGRCVSLELQPELHRIGKAASAVAAARDEQMQRLAIIRGSIYDVETLNGPCAAKETSVAFAYASKFASMDGEHAENLSAILASSQLPASAVVIVVNRKLCAEDGWEEAAPPLEGDTPHETAGRGLAYFFRRRAR